jgi:hypothetical protein
MPSSVLILEKNNSVAEMIWNILPPFVGVHIPARKVGGEIYAC